MKTLQNTTLFKQTLLKQNDARHFGQISMDVIHTACSIYDVHTDFIYLFIIAIVIFIIKICVIA